MQKLIFPEGVIYDLEKQAFRTTKVNSVFQLIASNTGGNSPNKTGQEDLKIDLSCYVGAAGQLSNEFSADLEVIRRFAEHWNQG